MAGDPTAQLMVLGILAGNVGTGAYGGVDVLTGETHGLNSGEIPLDTLLFGMPVLGMSGGMAAAAAASPEALATLEGLNMAAKVAKSGPPPSRESMRESATDFMRHAEAAAKRRMEKDPSLTHRQAIAQAGIGGRRKLLGGALAGTLTGAVPAIMMMQDAPPEIQGG